jgi:sporulation protein YlmC with PRC-barrel domain
MRFLKGAEVFAANGESVGRISRVVIDAKTREITDLVVERGAVFKDEKVVPIGLVNTENENQITLRETNQNLDDFLNYETNHYVSNDDLAEVEQESDIVREYYWYPPVNFQIPVTGILPGGTVVPDFVPRPRTETSIPEGRVAIADGAQVIGSDEKHIGNVEQVLADSQTNNITHFVVGKGLLLKERKLVPAFWVSRVEEDKVYLSVESGMFDRLPDYQPD